MKPPRYPIYIISKGRYDSRYTSRTLEYMNVPYYIVVEPQRVYSIRINGMQCEIELAKTLGIPIISKSKGTEL
jgi:hypothetical protein